MKNRLKKYFLVLGVLFLLVDFSSTCYHYYNLELDGDLTKIAAPIKWYEDVLNDPFGFTAIKENKHYGGAGRYMAHASLYYFYRLVPNIINLIIKDPVKSVFLSNAVLSGLIYFLLLFLFLRYINVRLKLNNTNVLWILILSAVSIQLGPFYDGIGIIDRSASYVFFYALPLLLLCYYFYFFYRKYYDDQFKFTAINHFVLFVLAIFLSFNGPLIQPIVFIVALLLVLKAFLFDNKLKRFIFNQSNFIHLSFLLLLCIYGFYISTYNSERNISVDIFERYKLLIKGIYHIITVRYAIPILVLSIGINFYVIYKMDKSFLKNNKQLWYFIALFIVIYLLLLPLGGYRSYRPLIIRYDTFMPVTFLLLFTFLYSTSFILANKLYLNKLKIYISFLIFYVFIFTIFDSNMERKLNDCQIESLYRIHRSNNSYIKIPRNCKLGVWQVDDLNDKYTQNMLTKLFKEWNIIHENQQLK